LGFSQQHGYQSPTSPTSLFATFIDASKRE
jgi:hypothetical protein